MLAFVLDIIFNIKLTEVTEVIFGHLNSIDFA